MRKPCAVLTLISMFLAVSFVHADDHLVGGASVKGRLSQAASERASNLASVERALSSPHAGKLAAAAGVDLDRVRRSLPQLGDADLRDLSRRAAALRTDPIAGHYGDAEDALVFVIIVSAAALVLIAVADRA